MLKFKQSSHFNALLSTAKVCSTNLRLNASFVYIKQPGELIYAHLNAIGMPHLQAGKKGKNK